MYRNVGMLVEDICKQNADSVAYIEQTQYRRKIWTYATLEFTIRRLASFLETRGLHKGDRIAVCAPNHPLWTCILFACARQGFVLVPLDVHSTATFTEEVLKRTNAKIIFSSLFTKGTFKDIPILSFQEIQPLLESIEITRLHDVDVSKDDLLEIVFTSGSTGLPKGVMITHQNILASVASIQEATVIKQNARFLSIIPLSHMFEQMAGLFVPLAFGARIVYPFTVRSLQIVRSLQRDHITNIVSVPALLTILKEHIEHAAEEQGRERQLTRILRWNKRLPMMLRRFLTASVHKKLGGKLRYLFVGGAPIQPILEDFWAGLGIVVLQGYGLTEASPFVTVNTVEHRKSYSVGRALPEHDVRISDDGEILIRGPFVSPGYYQDPESTKVAVHDGWFHTGDLGKFDRGGFLFIHGRSKNVIVNASGMKVYPEDIEILLDALPAVRESVVVGRTLDGRTKLTAVTLLHEGARLDQQKTLAAVNGRLASHQHIHDIVVWPDKDFPRTTTRKVIRSKVLEQISAPSSPTGKSSETVTPFINILSSVTGHASATIRPDTSLTSDLQLDSIMRLELVSRIEDELNVVVDETSITPTTTVRDLEALIEDPGRRASLSNWQWPLNPFVVVFRFFAQELLFLLLRPLQSLHVSGPQHVPKSGPVIIIANHSSHLDTPTIMHVLPWRRRLSVVTASAKDYFFAEHHRFLGFTAAFMFNAFPFDREGNVRESLVRIGELLDDGWSVLFYPEGTRSTDGKLHRFQSGIGVLSQTMEVPIVPVKIDGTFKMLPKGASRLRRGTITVRIGKPVQLPTATSYLEATMKLEETVRSL